MKKATAVLIQSFKEILSLDALLVFFLFISLWSISPIEINAQTANPVPVQFFYVPLPEEQILQSLQTLNTNGNSSVNPIQTYISIAAIADNTVIYYDQWENGFEPDIANPLNIYSNSNPGGTQIWGDGNPANGAPPGFPSDIINSGTVIILNNPVNTTTRQTDIDFDGGDKIAASKTISVARTGWATGSNTLLADALEVFDTDNWGTSFEIPVGENIPYSDSYRIFNYVGLSIMAEVGGANVQIDADANGTFETTVTLTEGKGYLVNGGVALGAKVISDKPIQIELLTGDRGEQYEARWFRLSPTALWSTSYYEPVSTSNSAQGQNGTGTVVWLYNPKSSPIAVQYQTRTGSGGNTITTNPITVPAKGYAKQVMTDGFGAKFFTNDGSKFYAISATDANNTSTNVGGNRSWDWGFTLVSESALTQQILIGLGIGRDPTSSTNPNENGNPIWVTPIGNGNTPVTIYVDYDANPATGPLTDPFGNKYDNSITLRELDRAKLYNPSGNQSGMLIYTLTQGVKLAAAWGQDPLTASSGAPGLDVGTGIPPLPAFDAGKNGTLSQDNDGDGFISPGDDLLYTIVVNNISRAPVPDLKLVDFLPLNTSYISNTTFFTNSSGVTSQVADNGSRTPFPLDEPGTILDNSSALPVGGAYTVTFKVRINDFEDLLPNTERIINLGYAAAIGDTIPINAQTPLFGRIGDKVWEDQNLNGIQDIGEPGIAGVTVKLYDGAGNLVATTTTDANGNYKFLGLLPGNYQVEFIPSSVYDFTTANADGTGLNGAKNSDANPSTGKTEIFTLAAGERNTNIDAGFKPNGLLGDKVWNDENQNGIQDPSETGIDSVTVKLFSCDGTFLKETITNANGNYTFTNLLSGSYYVQFTLPNGLNFTTKDIGTNDNFDSDADVNDGKTECITYNLGDIVTNIDAGMYEDKVADIKIEKSVSNSNPVCGSEINYQIKVTNLGPDKGKGIEATEILPSGLEYVSHSASVGTYDTLTGKWIIGELNNGAFATLSITVKVNCEEINSSTFDLGIAKDFNLFVIEDLNQPSSDTEGKVAVERDANLGAYSIGDKLPNNSGDVLIVGRDLNYVSGSVYNGNVVYANNSNLPKSSVSVTNGTVRKDTVIDFSVAKVSLENLSTTLGNYQPTGTVELKWGGLTLTGTDPFLNVFSVLGSNLSTANSFTIDVPNGSVVLVNINGTNVSWTGGLQVNGTAINNVIYNFYEATSLRIQGTDVRGSILAPLADLNFPSGVVNGQVIVKSMTGAGQFNLAPFIGNIPYEKEITNIASISAITTVDPDLTNNNSSVLIKPVTSNNGNNGGNNGGNSGGNWENLCGFGFGEIVYTLAYSNTAIYAGTWGGNIYISTNQGTSWTKINQGMSVGFVWSLKVVNDNLIFAATEKGLYKYNGSNWTLTTLSGMDVHSISIGTTGSTTRIFAATWGNGVYTSTDFGATWLHSVDGCYNLLAMNTIEAVSAEKAFVTSFGGGVFVTVNGGVSWSKINLGYSFAWTVASSGNYIYAGTYGDGLYLSSNGGTNWSKVTTLNAPFIYSLVVDNSGFVYAASWTSGVSVSKDNGATWTSLGMGGFGVSSIFVNPSTQDLFVGTKEGEVFFSRSGGTTDIDENSIIPTEFGLEQNYPNPFNPTTTIQFALPQGGMYKLMVYSVLGEEVAELVNNELSAGIHKVSFDASRLSSGMYIYRLTGNNVTITKKMLLMK